MCEKSSDTWSDIQAFKSRQISLREKRERRKKEREDIVLGIVCSQDSSISQTTSNLQNVDLNKSESEITETNKLINIESVERKLLQCLCDVALKIPIDSRSLFTFVKKALNADESCDHKTIDSLLQKFALQGLITTVNDSFTTEGETCTIVSTVDHSKLIAFAHEVDAKVTSDEKDDSKTSIINSETQGLKRSNEANSFSERNSKKRKSIDRDKSTVGSSNLSRSKSEDGFDSEILESLLSLPSAREKENKKMGEELLELLSKPTAKEKSIVERFRSVGGAQVQEFCTHGTLEECVRISGNSEPCVKLHFKKIIQKHTDESLGDCSFLNTCFHMDTCKYVHYEVNYSTVKSKKEVKNSANDCIYDSKRFKSILYPPQWIQCDLRFFDMSSLGKFSVIMADPPWDIHMELPYGTMSDDEMRKLNIPSLQDEGLIFLWVTGRAMELGRECLSLWGYERCDEIIWVKTNQLQRIIRTGRTGHWLNHGKEHCLVGIKGQPNNINRGLDCDVIVAEVRATSHKPDEIYGIIERLSPGTKKIELFGRPHNTQPNWITLGNQLAGVRLLDPELIEAFRARYPDGDCMKKPVQT
ncbi:N6-adenosine-methyltransferase subunit-like protein [Dinothrombium tinctorium]|uniref:mRNA m(6)A methyltransferase n=1 Tax=Dinothrombium tinctorium TaxID=1965070 RepID=A0A3S3PLS7_9ACAR|nr:N6-adenosine-methyltransferase subunit-like protein [Dinothrombium tinctorium]